MKTAVPCPEEGAGPDRPATPPAIALMAGVLAAVLALAAATALAAVLRRAALRSSHEEPIEDLWMEPAPRQDPALVSRGRALFLDSCAHCHGADATGDEGPDLHDLQVSDRYIARTVTRGIKGEMPSFARKHGSEDIRALTAYLRTLS